MDGVKAFYTQAHHWWGPNLHQDWHDTRAATVARLCGPSPKRMLELGAGTGGTAATMADWGHDVVAVEFAPPRVAYARALAQAPRPGSLMVLEADFYTVVLDGQFDIVCYWDGFGVGTDADQRRVLRRMATEWLAPAGCVLLEVFSPIGPARNAGLEELKRPVPGVPTSVEMIRRYHFDPVQCRWMDEWQPVGDPSQARTQLLRCYTPADFLLLLEGTGLKLVRLEVAGDPLDVSSPHTMQGPLRDAYSYLVQLQLHAPHAA
jgi:SAM-dependent methyltransferase